MTSTVTRWVAPAVVLRPACLVPEHELDDPQPFPGGIGELGIRSYVR